MNFVYLVTLDREFESPIVEDIFLHERDAISACEVLNKGKDMNVIFITERYNYEKLRVKAFYE
jgi:hypothetical protein